MPELCWCGNEIDENGQHLSLNLNSLSNSYMRMAEGKVEHLRDKPGRTPKNAPVEETKA